MQIWIGNKPTTFNTPEPHKKISIASLHNIVQIYMVLAVLGMNYWLFTYIFGFVDIKNDMHRWTFTSDTLLWNMAGNLVEPKAYFEDYDNVISNKAHAHLYSCITNTK